MAQTANGYTMRNCQIEISADNVVWSDISGYSNKVEWDGGEVDTADTHTFDGSKPILSQGKKSSLKITISIVATEGVSEPARVAQSAYENESPLYVRWSPKKKVSGSMLYTSDSGIVTKPVIPSGDTEKADITLIDIEVATAGITPSQVA